MANKYKISTPDDRRRDGVRALAEHAAEAQAVNKNMARLRALRLEREARGEAPAAKPEPVKKQPAAVSRYQKHQKAIGRDV